MQQRRSRGVAARSQNSLLSPLIVPLLLIAPELLIVPYSCPVPTAEAKARAARARPDDAMRVVGDIV